jgi:hypothetical protein
MAPCSVLDAIPFEKRGIPAAVVITEPLEAAAEAMTRPAGMAGYSHAAVPHPFGSVSPAAVSARADKVVDRIEELLPDS